VAAATPPSTAHRLVGAVLRHPVGRRVKGWIREGLWRVRARRLANPRLDAQPRTLLFLCLGNICRSPFAAVLAERRLRERGLDGIRVASAGLRASQAPASPPDAVAAAAGYGIDLGGHRARDVAAEEIAAADVIVVMEVAQVAQVRARFPEAVDRVHLLPLYEAGAAGRHGALEGCNLLDPFGAGPAAFTHCYRRIDAAIDGLVGAVAALPPRRGQDTPAS
jgi:protein-tyrosine phosphatase